MQISGILVTTLAAATPHASLSLPSRGSVDPARPQQPTPLKSTTCPNSCSLLGECTPSGGCVCDPPWSGPDCSTLPTHAAPAIGAYHIANSTWGGRPLKIGSTYHLFVSDVGPCGLHQFKSFSRIVHAAAELPEGPYRFVDVAVPSTAHNAYPLFGPGGEILIYYIGSPYQASGGCDGPPPPDDVVAPINVAVSASGNPSGPWEYHRDLLAGVCQAANADWCATVSSNPAVTLLKNGSALMAFHGTEAKNKVTGDGGEAPGIAIGDSYRGPFRLANPRPIFESPHPYLSPTGGWGNATFRGEDFFLWEDTRGFHLIWHVKQPFANSSAGWKMSGAMGWSTDGVSWTPSPYELYNGTPQWEGGSDLVLCSRQRPLLFFGDPNATSRPTHLFNGVQACGADDFSWTAVIPLA